MLSPRSSIGSSSTCAVCRAVSLHRTVAGEFVEKLRYAAASRRTIRSVVSEVLQRAALHQAIPHHPVPSPLRSPEDATPRPDAEDRRRPFAA
jgi:hypothetical protein